MTTLILVKDLDDTQQEKQFTFDYSFWSHDAFVENAEGLSVADGPGSPYSTQQDVYDALGVSVLNNAWEGGERFSFL